MLLKFENNDIVNAVDAKTSIQNLIKFVSVAKSKSGIELKSNRPIKQIDKK